jgi:hypothetical protein
MLSISTSTEARARTWRMDEEKDDGGGGAAGK